MHLVANQINRLKSRFGEKAFDDEFVTLVKNELRNMVDANVIRCVDVFIGNRPHHKPPVLSDFRDARLAEEKVKLEYCARGAMNAMSRHAQGGLQAYLAKDFPGCKTLMEAVAVRQHQIRIAKADDPNYEPMTDPKWMGGA